MVGRGDILPAQGEETVGVRVQELLRQRRDLWRGGEFTQSRQEAAVATGFAALDAHLRGGGWPRAGVSEILCDRPGGALALLLPALARLSREEGGAIFMISPPYIPYAPGLVMQGMNLERLLLLDASDRQLPWTLEQVLAEGCAAALAWPKSLDRRICRRLQLAAERGGSSAFLLRQSSAAEEGFAAAALRLQVATDGLSAAILRRPGGWPVAGIRLQ